MAKTRIKNTPTRLQKDALIASASSMTVVTTAAASATTATTIATPDVKKRGGVRLQTNTISTTITQSPKEQLQATSTIIVPAPKRTNSISSVTSTISHTSDTPSAHSDTESPPLPLAASNASKTLSSILCAPQAGNILKNRKVFMITEKCEEPRNGDATGNASAPQKRKMYLIMEENTTQGATGDAGGIEAAQKYLKMENGATTTTGTKKLTLYADKCDGELTQKFEKILPEILNRIHGVKSASTTATTTASTKLQNVVASAKLELKEEAPTKEAATLENHHNINNNKNNRRLPVTLPPKKNRTKIINTQIATNATVNQIINNTNQNNGAFHHAKQISAATPVIVSAASLNYLPVKKINGQSSATPATPIPAAQLTPQKNINLSTDFLFLMKMLPKLESIPEPHKNHVRSCIEKIVTQNSNVFEK